MAFPLDPTNGEQTTQNGIVYTYNATLGVWSVLTNTAGNISANNIAVTNAVSSDTVSATGNITGGNIDTAGQIIATGNVTGGNIVTAGTVSAGGNIVGNYILGNGSQLTGLPEGYGNTQVASYLPTYTGNLAGGNLSISGVSVLSGNVTASHMLPASTGNFDLGTADLRWRNIYTNDLNLNNGIGDWTIVEGADDLFLYNNLQSKVYKFALIEVAPEEATPKILKD